MVRIERIHPWTVASEEEAGRWPVVQVSREEAAALYPEAAAGPISGSEEPESTEG